MNWPSLSISKRSPLPLSLPPKQCVSLLKSITKSKCLLQGKQLHALLLSSGLLLSSTLLQSKLASMYALVGRTSDARNLFDRIPARSGFLYNTLIRGYVQCGLHGDALGLFADMVASGFRPDNFTYPFVLKACGDVLNFKLGVVIHCKALASGFCSDEYVQNSLIAMYMNSRDKKAAAKVFDGMCKRSVVSWNTMINGCFQNGCAEEALQVFDQMVDASVGIDHATVVSVLPACAHLKDLQRGQLVHKLVDEFHLGDYVPVRNSLIDMYSKCGSLGEARRIFDDAMYERDVVSWTAMIGGYILHGCGSQALSLSHHMMILGIRPNAVTMASLLSACASLPSINHGKSLHGSCIRLRLETDIIVETALIDMYAKCGSTKLSSMVFEKGSKRTATWNAIISGYARNEQADCAIEQFKLMQAEAVQQDLATISSLLPAYAEAADLRQAKNVHGYLFRLGFLLCMEVTTGLIDAYAKAGNLDTAWVLFHGLPVKDFVSWSAIIAGYGMHGYARVALLLFERMVESGVEPNEVTFTSLLYSCSHAGLVDEGLQLYKRMLNVHCLRPKVDHCACLVDLLGRAGRLKEAYGLIKEMPFEPNHAVWGALLGACVLHENVEFGELAAKHLFEIEPENTGNYVLLGNIYSAVGRWEDVKDVRRTMTERGLIKEPGCSLVEARSV